MHICVTPPQWIDEIDWNFTHIPIILMHFLLTKRPQDLSFPCIFSPASLIQGNIILLKNVNCYEMMAKILMRGYHDCGAANNIIIFFACANHHHFLFCLSCWLPVIIYVISYNIVPRYNSTQLYEINWELGPGSQVTPNVSSHIGNEMFLQNWSTNWLSICLFSHCLIVMTPFISKLVSVPLGKTFFQNCSVLGHFGTFWIDRKVAQKWLEIGRIARFWPLTHWPLGDLNEILW